MDTLKGWHRRGYLPPYDGGEITQFITFRLHDSLLAKVMNSLENMTDGADTLEKQRRAERFLDKTTANVI